MLKKLSIRHFAIIDQLDLEFQLGLNILSGETGAGKSIILQALSLVLGERGYADLIRTGEEECEVKAVFDLCPLPDLQDRWATPEKTLILRRVLPRSGKNKVWINDQPATAGDLQALKNRLVDLVSQHESQSLLQEERPRVVLDLLGRHEGLLQEYRFIYERYLSSQLALQTLKAKALEVREKEDLFRFQLREICEARLKKDEEEALQTERKVLSNAAKISETVSGVEGLLYSAGESVTELLGRARSALGKIAGIDPELDRQGQALHSHSMELEEIGRFLQNYLSRFEFDPDRLTALEDRLDQIARLKKKYGGSVEAVLEKADELEKSLGLLDHFEDRLKDAQDHFEQIQKELKQKAERLTQLRKKVGIELARKMERELAELAMGKTQFEVKIAPCKTDGGQSPFGPQGMDEVEFLMAPHPGEALKPLSRIASGEELSRVLLALKGILREPQAVDCLQAVGRLQAVGTYLFDEVDAGIGGAVAQVVGEKLKRLSKTAQVVCITHLPQIAAFADAHYQIAKVERGRRTVTQVKQLKEEEREEEIARMLAGVKITEKARLHARELITQVAGLK